MEVTSTQAAIMKEHSVPDSFDPDDGAFESLKGYEQELMGLLDLFSRSDAENSSDTNFNSLICNSNEGFQDLEDLDDMPIPDLMNPETGSWTEFLMNDFSGDEGCLFPAFNSAHLPSDFLAVAIAPPDSCQMQPSLPASMFPLPADAALEESQNPFELPVPADSTSIGPKSSVFSQNSSTSVAEALIPSYGIEVVQHETANISGLSHLPAQDVLDTERSTDSQDQPGKPGTTEPVAKLPDQAAAESANAVKRKIVKRKRPVKVQDPNVPKRKAGRPRAIPGLNCIKHVQAFQKDGGFTLGETAELLKTGEQAILEAVAQDLQATKNISKTPKQIS